MQATSRRFKAGLLLAGLFFVLPAMAATDVEAALAKGRENMASAPARPDAASAGANSTAMPAPPAMPTNMEDEAKAAYAKAQRGYYDYLDRGYQYRTRVFEWQLFSSHLIFGIVIVLVLAGLTFAAVQFYVAMVAAVAGRHRRGRGAAPAEGDAASDSLTSELGISDKGLTVKSSVLGVVILALSLAFFYLYLVYVYPIHEVI
jgi:hypothetical protein